MHSLDLWYMVSGETLYALWTIRSFRYSSLLKNQNETVIHSDPNVRVNSEVNTCLTFQRESSSWLINPIIYSS